jgi:hypothetical protein
MCSSALTGTRSFFRFFPPFKPHFDANDLQHNKTLKLTKTLENNKTKSLTNIIKGLKYTIFGTHQIPPNLHSASPLAKQNEKHIQNKKHKSDFVGETVAFSICNKPFKPLGIPKG